MSYKLAAISNPFPGSDFPSESFIVKCNVEIENLREFVEDSFDSPSLVAQMMYAALSGHIQEIINASKDCADGPFYDVRTELNKIKTYLQKEDPEYSYYSVTLNFPKDQEELPAEHEIKKLDHKKTPLLFAMGVKLPKFHELVFWVWVHSGTDPTNVTSCVTYGPLEIAKFIDDEICYVGKSQLHLTCSDNSQECGVFKFDGAQSAMPETDINQFKSCVFVLSDSFVKNKKAVN